MANAAHLSAGTAKMIGFLLAICGNTLIACSLTLQKFAHNSISDHDVSDYTPAPDEEAPQSPPSEPASDAEAPDTDEISHAQIAQTSSSASSSAGLRFLANPTWWMGTFLMAAGEVGNFAAFAFAPASLVAPLGVWSVVLSAILAHVFLREHVSNRNTLGIVLCVVGAFLIGVSGPDIDTSQSNLDQDTVTKLLLRLPFVVFMLLTLTATAVLIFIAHRTTLGERYIFIYVGVSSLLGGVTVVCAKAISTFLRLTIEGDGQLGNWLPFVLAVILASAILLQLRYLNMAMARYGNSQVIPVYYVLFTTCAMSSGVIMYREFDALTLGNIPFFLGICSTMSGVFLVSKSAKKSVLLSDSDLKERTKAKVTKITQDEDHFRTMLPLSPVSSPTGEINTDWS